MSRFFEVVTPEQVAIRYELAGFGSRGLAAMLDTGIQLLILLAVSLPLSLMMAPGGVHADNFFSQLTNSTLIGILILLQFIITWGYWIGFETLWNGETPGKRLLHLRVIKDGGFPIDFRAALIRNLLRAVDVLPGLMALPIYDCAFISVLCNPQYKRLGDFAAGTLVVRYAKDEGSLPEFTFGEAQVLRLFDATTLSALPLITREDMRLVQRYLQQRTNLAPPLRAEFATRLAAPLMEKLHYPTAPDGLDYERWLDELNLAYRTRSLGAMQRTSGNFSLIPAPATPPTPTPTVIAPLPSEEIFPTAEAPTELDEERRW
jgi:uncharacterized RDD family membrane protein YckC